MRCPLGASGPRQGKENWELQPRCRPGQSRDLEGSWPPPRVPDPCPALAQGGNCEISGKSDADDFRRLLAAMEVLGFSAEDQDSIFRILASILHLGNVYFEKYEVRGHHGRTARSLGKIGRAHV